MIEALAGPWGWIALGLVLVAIETIAPGMFLVWFGVAALIVGALSFLVGMPFAVALVLFALLGVAAVFAGRALSRRSDVGGQGDRLHRLGENMIGRTAVLEEPLLNGQGRLRLDDTFWRITGPDMVAGARVRIAGIEGTVLRVESVGN